MNLFFKLVLIITILSIGSLLMASGIALSGVGSRAISMGGAMRGLSDDFTAIYWNPAGLANIEQSSINLRTGTTCISKFILCSKWFGQKN